MIDADSRVRKIEVRLIASFQIGDRDPSRLQCSVARIAAASGPNGRSPGWSRAVLASSLMVPPRSGG